MRVIAKTTVPMAKSLVITGPGVQPPAVVKEGVCYEGAVFALPTGTGEDGKQRFGAYLLIYTEQGSWEPMTADLFMPEMALKPR